MKSVFSTGLIAILLMAAPFTAQNAMAARSMQSSNSQLGTNSTQGAQNFVATMGQQALNFLRDPSMGQSGKEDAFRQLLENSFDMSTIAKFTMGTYYRQLNQQQQAEYLGLFREWVVKVYSSRFAQYKGQSFNVVGARPDDAMATDTIVNSQIVAPDGGQPVNVNWRIRNAGNGYHIVDVMVEGVSMSQTQRSDFASVIQRAGGNPAALIDQLRQQTSGGGR